MPTPGRKAGFDMSDMVCTNSAGTESPFSGNGGKRPEI